MKRGARFVVLDQNDPQNKDSDYVVLNIAHAQLSPLIEQLTQCLRISEAERSRQVLGSGKETFWAVHILVEAHHPKAVGKTPKDVTYPPSLLKDSIPRPGRS